MGKANYPLHKKLLNLSTCTWHTLSLKLYIFLYPSSYDIPLTVCWNQSYHHCHGYLIIITVYMCCCNTTVDVISKFPKAKWSQNLRCTHLKLLSIDSFIICFPAKTKLARVSLLTYSSLSFLVEGKLFCVSSSLWATALCQIKIPLLTGCLSNLIFLYLHYSITKICKNVGAGGKEHVSHWI